MSKHLDQMRKKLVFCDHRSQFQLNDGGSHTFSGPMWGLRANKKWPNEENDPMISAYRLLIIWPDLDCAIEESIRCDKTNNNSFYLPTYSHLFDCQRRTCWLNCVLEIAEGVTGNNTAIDESFFCRSLLITELFMLLHSIHWSCIRTSSYRGYCRSVSWWIQEMPRAMLWNVTIGWQWNEMNTNNCETPEHLQVSLSIMESKKRRCCCRLEDLELGQFLANLCHIWEVECQVCAQWRDAAWNFLINKFTFSLWPQIRRMTTYSGPGPRKTRWHTILFSLWIHIRYFKKFHCFPPLARSFHPTEKKLVIPHHTQHSPSIAEEIRSK